MTVRPEWFGEDDLYPDVRACAGPAPGDGLWVGIAGNQTVRAGGILRELEPASGHDRYVG